MGRGGSGAERSVTGEFSPVYFVTPEEAKNRAVNYDFILPTLIGDSNHCSVVPLLSSFLRICYSSPSVHVKTMRSYCRVDD